MRKQSMTSRRGVLAALPAITLALTAGRARAEPAKLLRVGQQKGEPIVMAMKQHRMLETLLAPHDIEVQWTEFQFGPPLLEAMRVGSIDIGAVGDTPPVFAQAAHGDLLYVAGQRGGGEAILVPPGSTLQTLHDLKGRKIAFGRGSGAQNLTLAALEKAGLAYTDVQPLYLAPADAGAAFERGAIDAWTIWDPYYALFESRPGVRVLATRTDIIEQNGFIMARRPFVEANPQLTAELVAAFIRTAEWARGHRPDVAKLLSDATGIPLAAMQRTIDRASMEVLPMNDQLVRSQQAVADRFRKIGLLPTDIKVSDQVWRPGA
jgi:NitT/TauT family transport system substrate-binding protein/sulfonate transport system substrate-binding protein